MCRYRSSGYGLVSMVVLGGWLDLMRSFPTYDSMIPMIPMITCRYSGELGSVNPPCSCRLIPRQRMPPLQEARDA